MMCLQISPAKTFIVITIFCHEEVTKSGRKTELKVDQIASTSKDFKEEFALAVCVCTCGEMGNEEEWRHRNFFFRCLD